MEGEKMKKLDEEKLKKVKGGVSFWVGVAIAGTIIFISGIIEGIAHPKKCN